MPRNVWSLAQEGWCETVKTSDAHLYGPSPLNLHVDALPHPYLSLASSLGSHNLVFLRDIGTLYILLCRQNIDSEMPLIWWATYFLDS